MLRVSRDQITAFEKETRDAGARLTADAIITTLGFEPHPTCGLVAENYRSRQKISAGALPNAYDGGDRPFGSILYFLIAPDAQIVMHRIRPDQFYHPTI